MRILASCLSRWHFRIFLVLWLLFSALTLYIVSVGLDDAADRPGKVAVTTAATLLGPMTGAISRDCQSCCLQFSLTLLPYCGAALALAVLAQFVHISSAVWLQVVRLMLWTAGLLIWFGGGIVSFGHAFS